MLVESVLGNAADPGWQDRLAGIHVDRLVLDQWEAQKHRLRKHTSGGVEVALSLGRGTRLRDGDILAWDDPGGTATVVHLMLGEVMAVDLGEVASLPPETLVRTAVEFGHAIGNQHWPAVVKGTTVYVPVTVDRKVMDSVMRTHAFAGVSHGFVDGTEVLAFLAPHEARRLFGGADVAGHAHLAAEPG
ncbi:urease accessory protein UreE [Dactylosporangium sucinum]|uniref:Urease accessory protein UreE n=1 Tax=Dactylosporangium sucinum TaxID=1424081 RepID=A0A917TN97_9ACTN|nr:urease accessory protein UreE [Dactylosporangium sucinum]GGM29567.1 urease accessory protein UreE [Dactylosporangium sucinum]